MAYDPLSSISKIQRLTGNENIVLTQGDTPTGNGRYPLEQLKKELGNKSLLGSVTPLTNDIEQGVYIASEVGVYLNFGNIEVTQQDFDNGLVLLTKNNDGTFSKDLVPMPGVVLESQINVEGGVTGFNPIGQVADGDMRAVSGDLVNKSNVNLKESLSPGNIAISGQRYLELNEAISELYISGLKSKSPLTITNITIDLASNHFRVFIYQDGVNLMDTNYIPLKEPYFDNIYKLKFNDKDIDGYIVLNENRSFATSGVTILLDFNKVTNISLSPIIMDNLFYKNNLDDAVNFTSSSVLNPFIAEMHIVKDRNLFEITRLYVRENSVRLFIKTKTSESNSDIAQLAFDNIDDRIYGKVLTIYHTTKLEVVGYVVLKKPTGKECVFDGKADIMPSVISLGNSPKIDNLLNRKEQLLFMSSSTFGFKSNQNVLKEFTQENSNLRVFNAGFGGCRMSWRTSNGTNNYDAFSGVDVADALVNKDFTKQKTANTALNNTFKERLTDLINVDLSKPTTIFVKYIDNDITGGAVIGELWKYTDVLTDYDKTTFLGAMNYVVEKLSTQYPHIKWVFWSESWRYKTDKDNNVVPPYAYVNSIGNKGLIYSEKEKENCERLGLNFFDFVNNGIQNNFNNSVLFVDQTHFNYLGNILLSDKVVSVYNLYAK